LTNATENLIREEILDTGTFENYCKQKLIMRHRTTSQRKWEVTGRKWKLQEKCPFNNCLLL